MLIKRYKEKGTKERHAACGKWYGSERRKVMEFICCALLAYLIGTFNPSYFLAAAKGFDIRKRGSGNAGASNVIIVFGKAVGAVCALLDIGKACFAIWVTGKLFADFSLAFPVAAVMCIIGHIFPFYMKFKGGKGLACLGGVILMYSPKVFAVMLLLELVIVLIVDYLCVVPMSAAAAFPVVYGVMDQDMIGMSIMFVVTVVMCIKHIENLRRIKNGTEVHFSFLWNKDKEIARIKENGATEGE